LALFIQFNRVLFVVQNEVHAYHLPSFECCSGKGRPSIHACSAIHRIPASDFYIPWRPKHIYPEFSRRRKYIFYKSTPPPSHFTPSIARPSSRPYSPKTPKPKAKSKKKIDTDNDLSVNQIDTSTFDAWSYCNFYTTGQRAVVGSRLGATVQIGPPQPITAVACQPTPNPPGTCLPVFGKKELDLYKGKRKKYQGLIVRIASCEWCGGGNGGCYLLGCCDGFCAATKCRPFTQPSAV
jgi:hypothetical protein